MPRKHRGNYRAYSLLDLEGALKAIEDNGMSVRAAASQYGIPKTTLLDKMSGRSQMGSRSGCDPVLGWDLENEIAKWVVKMAQVGFPLRSIDLKTTVQKICRDEGISNPFPNDTPGRTWFTAFMKRHPELSLKSPEHHSKGRASVTEETMRAWYSNLHTYLRNEGLLGLLMDPRRWFNADEKALFLNPMCRKFLGKKGETVQSLDSAGGEKDNLTVLVNYNAAGEKPPQMVVFKLIRSRPSLEKSIPNGWIMGKSKSGWMKSETFLYWLQHFYDWCIEKDLLNEMPEEVVDDKTATNDERKEKKRARREWSKQQKQRVLLFVDGHASHVTVEASEFCEDRGIILYCLVPNATHVMQPADATVMAVFEVKWQDVTQKYKLETGGASISKEQFTPLAKEALDQVSKEVLIKSFEVTGIFPLNQDAPRYDKLLSHHRKSDVPQEAVDEASAEDLVNSEAAHKATLNVIENFVDADTLQAFKSTLAANSEWKGSVEKTDVYAMWKQLKTGLPQAATSDINSLSVLIDAEMEEELILELGAANTTTESVDVVIVSVDNETMPDPQICALDLEHDTETLPVPEAGVLEPEPGLIHNIGLNITQECELPGPPGLVPTISAAISSLVPSQSSDDISGASSSAPLQPISQNIGIETPESLPEQIGDSTHAPRKRATPKKLAKRKKTLALPTVKEPQNKRRRRLQYQMSDRNYRADKRGYGSDDDDWECNICKSLFSDDEENSVRNKWTTCDVCGGHMHYKCISRAHKKVTKLASLIKTKSYPFVCEACVTEK